MLIWLDTFKIFPKDLIIVTLDHHSINLAKAM